ncbi:ion channel [Arthrobacter roseus]|uniref:ion channel n=1 Tax=Arthrobacter roseus TaxID=136274 RepID=UPI001EF98425|nr:ion channel [Arthrobacter roseus]MBM7848681.1 voltage-gated potassium channel [Arthrobacter roseus]
MPFVLSRLIRRLRRSRFWVMPALIIIVVFLTSWPLMIWAEPSSNTITSAESYWWWFLVTSATVGYGDFFPTTVGGRLVGVYVIVGGIVTLTTLFTRIAMAIENSKGQRMKGQLDLDMSDHLVIVGYTPGRTERLLHEITADDAPAVALCAWEDVPENPVPEQPDLGFVRGDLAEESVLRRAGVHRAARVLIDARDDNEALAVTVAVTHVNPNAHTVVTLRDMNRALNFSYVDADVRCVQWHSPRLATEELQDPGIAVVYADLMSHGGRNTYSTPLPEALPQVNFGQVQEAMGRSFTTTVLAVQHEGAVINPGWDTQLPESAVLYYVGERRLSPEEIIRALAR